MTDTVETFRLLCTCLAARSLPEAPRSLRGRLTRGSVDWPRLIQLSSAQLVTTNLREALRRKGLLDELPSEVAAYLEGVHDLNTERNRLLTILVRDAATVLNQAGVIPMVLKGMANLLDDAYSDPGERMIGDVDLLIPTTSFEEALVALRDAGFREHLKPNAKSAVMPLARDSDVASLDVHGCLHNQRIGEILPAADLWSQATEHDANGARVLVPAGAHRILHNIVHTQIQDANALRGSVALRQLCDLVILRQKFDRTTDWAFISRLLAANGHTRALEIYVFWGECLLGMPAPVEVPRPAFAGVSVDRLMLTLRHRHLRAWTNVLTRSITTCFWLRRRPSIVLDWAYKLGRPVELRRSLRRLGFRF